MALSEFEVARCKRAIARFMEKRRPPPEVRDELDFECRIAGQSVELHEVRPFWRDASRIIESPVAKATWVKSKRHWRVFWHRADGKWHRYDPCPEIDTLEAFFELVDQDAHACFFG